MVSINKETRDMIIREAMSLMVDGLLTPIPTDEGVRYHINDATTVNTIIDAIADNGMTYVTSKEEISRLWDNLVKADEENQVIDWLTQNSISWEIIAFSSSIEYNNWVDHLVRAYSRFHPSSEMFGAGGKGQEGLICAHTEHVDRLPIDTEYTRLLHSNPWMVFLLTLQLDISRVHKLLLGGGDNPRGTSVKS